MEMVDIMIGSLNEAMAFFPYLIGWLFLTCLAACFCAYVAIETCKYCVGAFLDWGHFCSYLKKRKAFEKWQRGL